MRCIIRTINSMGKISGKWGGGVRGVERGGACGVGSTLQCDPNFLQCRFQLLTEMAWSSRLEWERELQPEFHPYRLSRAGTLN